MAMFDGCRRAGALRTLQRRLEKARKGICCSFLDYEDNKDTWREDTMALEVEFDFPKYDGASQYWILLHDSGDYEVCAYEDSCSYEDSCVEPCEFLKKSSEVYNTILCWYSNDLSAFRENAKGVG